MQKMYYQTSLLGQLYPILDDKKIKKSSAIKVKSDNLISGLINPVLLECTYETEGSYDMPILPAYQDDLPSFLIPFTQTTSEKCFREAVPHFFVYDKIINRVWNRPEHYVKFFKKHPSICGVDFSLFMDADRSVNIWNIYRNRILLNYYSKQGIKIIPSFSIGHPDCIEASIDGLPDNSVICMSNLTQRKNKSLIKLKKYAIERLIERKHPISLMVYGFPMEFEIPIKIKYYESIIQKLRKYEKNK